MKTKILVLIATALLFVLQSYSCLSKQEDDLIWEKDLKNSYVNGAKFIPDGSKIIALSGGYINIVDTETSEILFRFEEISENIFYVIDISKTAPIFATIDGMSRLWLFDYEKKKQIKDLGTGHRISFSGDGKYLAIGRGNNPTHNLDIYDFSKDSITKSFLLVNYFMNYVNSVKFSEDGKYLAVAYSGYQTENEKDEFSSIVAIFNTEDWSLIKNLNFGESGQVADLAFSPDGSKLAATYIECEAKTIIWDINDLSEKWRYNGGEISVYTSAICFTEDSKKLLISNNSKNAGFNTEIYDTESRDIVYTYKYPMKNGINISYKKNYICSPVRFKLYLYKLHEITNINEHSEYSFYIKIGKNIIDISEINMEEILNISISDIKGKEIINYSKHKIKTDGNSIFIDDYHLLSGAYFCTIKTGNKVITKKFIVSK